MDSDSESSVDRSRTPLRRRLRSSMFWPVVAAVSFSLFGLAVSAYTLWCLREEAVGWPNGSGDSSGQQPGKPHALPDGTNFGGWLVLEDWFFSGSYGTHVATIDKSKGQGQCLPPMLLGVKEPWKSEGLLGKALTKTQGAKGAARVFEAHRNSYIGLDDVVKLNDLGIRTIRIPIPWFTFADALTSVDAVYGAHNPDKDTVMVPDPFYVNETMYATVPRNLLRKMLGHFSRVGLRALIDIHAMPGGSSEGTYNGIWPMKPAFWQQRARIGTTNKSLQDCGILVAEALIRWVEHLDHNLQHAVAGLTIMNEPGHLAAYASGSDRFVDDVDDILGWLSRGAQVFRKSKLPGRGVKLYVNVIESSSPNFWSIYGSWFRREFTEAERNEWAVFDKHWYAAWLWWCQGVTAGNGGYDCNDDPGIIRSKVRKCIRYFASEFVKHVPSGLRSNSEFSASTNENSLLACGDPVVTRIFLEEEAHAMAQYGIQSFFWTWRMPYGRNFERAWSLKHLLGVEDTRPTYPCGPEYVNVTA